jgi:hypothetical protein
VAVELDLAQARVERDVVGVRVDGQRSVGARDRRPKRESDRKERKERKED